MNTADEKRVEQMMAEYWVHVQHHIDPKDYGVPDGGCLGPWSEMPHEMQHRIVCKLQNLAEDGSSGMHSYDQDRIHRMAVWHYRLESLRLARMIDEKNLEQKAHLGRV